MNSHKGRKRKGDFTMPRMLKLFVPVIFTLALFTTQVAPAFACGGLIAPNGAIRLSRAATLVAWHGGIERYMTSFTYQGAVSYTHRRCRRTESCRARRSTH